MWSADGGFCAVVGVALHARTPQVVRRCLLVALRTTGDLQDANRVVYEAVMPLLDHGEFGP